MRASFNPHLRVGGDEVPSALSSRAVLVSIHTSAWEVTLFKGTNRELKQVSIHTSAWEVTDYLPKEKDYQIVSIHTSAWEVTELGKLFKTVQIVSIHTSAWEVTSAHAPNPKDCRCFNPHLRVGGD